MSQASDPAAATLTWSVHPAREGPVRLALAVGVISIFAAAVFSTTGSILWAVFVAAIFFLSLARFFFPTVYTLDNDGLEARLPYRAIRRRWSDFASCQVERNGIFLSPYRKPSRLENYRGLFLMTRKDHQKIVEFVQERVGGKAA